MGAIDAGIFSGCTRPSCTVRDGTSARASSPRPSPIQGASYQLPVVVVEQAVGAPDVPACAILASTMKSFEPAHP